MPTHSHNSSSRRGAPEAAAAAAVVLAAVASARAAAARCGLRRTQTGDQKWRVRFRVPTAIRCCSLVCLNETISSVIIHCEPSQKKKNFFVSSLFESVILMNTLCQVILLLCARADNVIGNYCQCQPETPNLAVQKVVPDSLFDSPQCCLTVFNCSSSLLTSK